jgi:YD repeat-containing protein
VATTTLADGTASSARTTTTYGYDAAGNLTSEVTQGTSASANIALSYEYTGGRLAKTTTQNASGTTTDTYTYDGSGRIATYNRTTSIATEQYTYSNGVLTAGTLRTNGVQSGTVTVANGRITQVTYPGNTQIRYTYDANGSLTRIDITALNLNFYYLYERGTTAFVYPFPRPTNAPDLNLYGKSDLPITRFAQYENNTLTNETRIQQQANSKNYLSVLTVASTTAGRTATTTQTFTYSNCQ